MRLSRFYMPLMKENACRGADRLAPADAARRPDPPAIGRHLCLAAAGQAGAGEDRGRSCARSRTAPGRVEVLMPTIQSADLWRESGRYDAYGPEMLRIVDRHDREMLYGPTNEEMITTIFRDLR